MKRAEWVGLLAVTVMTGGWAVGAEAQWTPEGTGWCDEQWGARDSDRHCLELAGDFADPGLLVVDGGVNGGVDIEGWGGDRVEVRAKVWANARSEERARELAEAVRVEMRDGRLSADGPETERRESWGVSWEVRVPRSTDLEIETHNGGISVADVSGRIDFQALNGGVHLTGVGGDVSGRTTNGGLHVELDGDSWAGQGMDVETVNGGIRILVPDGYSARLETGTVNGGFDVEIPLMVQGRIGRQLTATLGDGGATLRAVTTNGGVHVGRMGSAVR